MEIITDMDPRELAENVANEEEAICVCAEILRRWSLSHPEYAQILDEIPDYILKQYLRLRQMEKAHRERLTEMLKNSRKTKNE